MEDRARTRMMLGLLVESQDEPALRAVLRENSGFHRGAAALALGRTADHPDVDIVLATLWGLGIQQLMYDDDEATRVRTERILRRLGQWIDAAPDPSGNEGQRR
jgi:hypothetical protein